MSSLEIEHKGSPVPISEAAFTFSELPTKERRAMWNQLTDAWKENSRIAEAEINAVVNRKAVGDKLFHYKQPHSATLLAYQNTEKEVQTLEQAVHARLSLSHRFYDVKKKLLDEKEITYADRSAAVGSIDKKFTFDDSCETLRELYQSLDSQLETIFENVIKERRIDVFPRKGKVGGAYNAGTGHIPTRVLLNHTDNYSSLSTFAHEMGHAFHSTLSSRGARLLYSGYSISTAEIASTFFETLLQDMLREHLSKDEQMILLHDRAQGHIQTVFRQMALFGFESELHEQIRKEGYASAQEIAKLLERHMQGYLGKVIVTEKDGYQFVDWAHIRYFFYVYTYAYGHLLSLELARRVQEDKSYFNQVMTFLSQGSTKDPKDLLADIGIETENPATWKNSLEMVANDIEELEKFV